MKEQNSHPEHGRGRPVGIWLNPSRGDELWEWVKTNWKEGGSKLVDRGDLAEPIHDALVRSKIRPPKLESLKSTLAAQFNGKRTIAKTTIQGLALLCGVFADELRKVLADPKALIATIQVEGGHKPPGEPVGDKPLPMITPPLVPLGTVEKEDRKNVIHDLRISEALIEGPPPSLRECVEATRTRLLRNDEKDIPIIPGWTYNHFFGIGTALFVTSPVRRQPVLLWYPRQPNDGRPKLLRGWSILFNASFNFDAKGDKSPMDLWVNSAKKDPEYATKAFERMRDGVLLQLLANKVKVPSRVEGTCHPLGVFTVDVRKTGGGRVYTYYVFQTTMDLQDATTFEKLKSDVASFGAPEWSPVSLCPNVDLQPKFFLSGQARTMDYLALRAMRGKPKKMKCKNTKFWPYFEIP
jgi:hypothetical protein